MQLEQRIILEKEREFALSKYENKLGLLMGLRSDIDHSYHLIHQLEEKYNVLDAKNMALDKRRHDNKRYRYYSAVTMNIKIMTVCYW